MSVFIEGTLVDWLRCSKHPSSAAVEPSLRPRCRWPKFRSPGTGWGWSKSPPKRPATDLGENSTYMKHLHQENLVGYD